MPGPLSRRDLLRALPGAGAAAFLAHQRLGATTTEGNDVDSAGRSDERPQVVNRPGPMSADVLPAGIRSRFVENINGLRMHVLEAGFETPGRPAVLLLHGFPELAFSWRNVMGTLADAGCHVIAPDQRGYGRTTGWDPRYDGDVASYRRLNIARDALGLVHAFGYRSVAGVVGHDWGSPIASTLAVARPDVFRSVVLMSAPFGGTGSLPFDTADDPPRSGGEPSGPSLAEALAALPRPRMHYTDNLQTREAAEDFWHPPQGLKDFLRAYHHFKSADWPGNRPYRLASRSAETMAQMPEYYILDLDKTVSETVAPHMPTPDQIAANTWLPDRDLDVYVEEFDRTGFQGGMNWYRAGGYGAPERDMYAGLTIDQPSAYIAGAADWGSYQNPGVLERMQDSVCTDMRGVHMIDGAGHWVQQEQAEETARLLVEFLREA
jgi:pimeloyl-ACP methyl ester carboxylesterase